MNDLIIPYCSQAWADTFFGKYLFNDVWDNSSTEKKTSALCHSTDLIDLYCTFYNSDGVITTYEHAGTQDDEDNIINPRKLKQACSLEAAYLLSLDDNPAQPHPLAILGLSKFEDKVIDKENVAPIFPDQVRALLESMGGKIDESACGGEMYRFMVKNPT